MGEAEDNQAEAHHLGGRPQENRGGAESKVGEDEKRSLKEPTKLWAVKIAHAFYFFFFLLIRSTIPHGATTSLPPATQILTSVEFPVSPTILAS